MPIFDVRHQVRAHRIVQRAIGSKRLPHAYIFHGPEGVGKRTLAMRFAQLLLCAEPTEAEPPPELAGDADTVWQDACGACDDCRLTTAGTHPDMQVVYKELNRYHPAPEVRSRKAIDLSVDVVRHFIINRIGDRPARGRARVFVVLNSDQMSVSAQNALLKTLEEPPTTAFLILVTRSLERLLPTTRSRCQPVPFVALPSDFVAERLRTHLPDLPPEQVHFLARYCDGRLGVALRRAAAGLLEVKVRLNQAVANLRDLGPTGFAACVQEDASKLADAYIAEMVEAGRIEKVDGASTTEPTRRGLMEMLTLTSCLYRDALQVGCDRSDQVINADQSDLAERLADRLVPEAAAEAIRDIYRTETDIANNANVPLALETLAIRLLKHEASPARRPGPATREDTR